MEPKNPVQELLQNRDNSHIKGMYSCCSANEFVIRAVMRKAKASGTIALIEATANQVNQFGGYTGMTPADFISFVHKLAIEEKLDTKSVVCGGDHLGPLTWQDLSQDEAMANATQLVKAYVLAGFSKIHIDTSMRVATDDKTKALSEEIIARRGAQLCKAAENAFAIYQEQYQGSPKPVYVIGSEVPIPGGARENEDSVSVTSAASCLASINAFHQEFVAHGLQDAWQRVVAIVVQPGVEFADESVVEYSRDKARALVGCLSQHKGLVFEGHSTDYQSPVHLREMAQDGIAILKVGPALTFALREGLFALEKIEQEVYSVHDFSLSQFRSTLERAMLQDDVYWANYFHGTIAKNRFARAFSFSDRARYYLGNKQVSCAITALLQNLAVTGIPLALLSQYLPMQYTKVQKNELPLCPTDILIDHIGDCIDTYIYAVLDH